MQELGKYLYKIVMASNILNIARCIFVFDFIDDIPKDYQLEKASFRPVIKKEQFRISLLSQGFELGNINLDENKIEVDIHDLYLDKDLNERILHCAQLLINVWSIWQRKLVYINYFARNRERICCVYADGKICEAISERMKKNICVDVYLGREFKIRYF